MVHSVGVAEWEVVWSVGAAEWEMVWCGGAVEMLIWSSGEVQLRWSVKIAEHF